VDNFNQFNHHNSFEAQFVNLDVAFMRTVLMKAKWSVITSFYCIVVDVASVEWHVGRVAF
jgi:hypothetical protein